MSSIEPTSKKRIFVIKVGGELFESAEKRQQLVSQLAQFSLRGISPVLVHGGGPQINKEAERRGLSPTFVHGLRVTDAKMLDVVESVLSYQINTPFVQELNSARIAAVGILCEFPCLFSVEPQNPELGFVGKVVSVDASKISEQLEDEYLPVVVSLGRDKEGQLYNINADIAAGKLAAALGAERLVVVSNIRGLYREFGNEESFVPNISLTEVQALIKSGKIGSGMLPKLEGLLEAMNNGVSSAQIVDGRETDTILSQIFSSPPEGTLITRE